MKTKRVAITGLGIICAIGESLEGFSTNLFAGQSGIGPVSVLDTKGFPCRNAAEIKKRDLEAEFTPRSIRRVSRCDLLGLIATREAIADSGLDLNRCDLDRIGVIMGGGAGGMFSWEKYRRNLWTGKKRPRPSLLLPFATCTLTDLIGSQYGITGSRATISTACSSSATAIGYGLDLIRSGELDAVITGGSEALSELTFAGFNSLRVMDPEFCRPFHRDRQGLSLGEGAGIVVLESHERAQARGAKIYAEILGYAINSDAHHMTSPDPDAKGMRAVMENALLAAGVARNEVDYINAHGTATKVNDRMEAKAIQRVFGDASAKGIAVSSTKSMVGHCLGASGAIESVATVLAIKNQLAPPTARLDTPDPDCPLDHVPIESRPHKIDVALSNSFAFGGNNTSLVFARV